MAEKWVSVSDACQILEVSERTLYRKIKDNKVESRMTDDGRREVLVSVPMTKEELAEGHLKLASETVDNQLKIVATALGSTEMVTKRMQSELEFVKGELSRVREQSTQEIERFQEQARQQIDYVTAEVVRARRIGWVGWSVVTGLMILIGIVAIWSVRSLSNQNGELTRARDQVEAEREKSSLLTDIMADKDRQITRLEGELDAVRADLTVKKAAMTDTVVPVPATQPDRNAYERISLEAAAISDLLLMPPSAEPLTTVPATFPASIPAAVGVTTQPTTQTSQPTGNWKVTD